MPKPMARAPGHAGRYEAQLEGYKAFIPATLPPDPPLILDDELTKLLSDADRFLGRLDGVTQMLPNLDLFLMMYVRKEAVFSSQIEGTQASLDDLVAYEDEIEEANNPRDVEEVVNYVAAMKAGLSKLKDIPVSLRLIREIHHELMQGVRGQYKNPGEFRTSQNWIGPQGCTLKDALFVPPPPHELIAAMGNLEKFLYEDEKLPILAKIGMAHAQFETIHPFLDGNGRLGRLLITFLLCEKEVLSQPALYLSHYFKRYKSEYYERLQGVRDKGDWEGWLKFFLKGVIEVSREASNTASKIMEIRERHRVIISENMTSAAAGNAFRLLEFLYQRPVATVNGASLIIEKSYSNARKLVLDLEALGIIQEQTGQARNRRYVYAEYLQLFR
ncbi:MAG: Fic family protein [Pseudomonadota bacterium]